MAKKNFGNLVDNAVEHINQKKQELSEREQERQKLQEEEANPSEELKQNSNAESYHYTAQEIENCIANSDRVGQEAWMYVPAQYQLPDNETGRNSSERNSRSTAVEESKEEESKRKKDKSEKIPVTKKTFYMHSNLNIAFNIAAAKRGMEKGVLLNMIIEEWLKKNGEM